MNDSQNPQPLEVVNTTMADTNRVDHDSKAHSIAHQPCDVEVKNYNVAGFPCLYKYVSPKSLLPPTSAAAKPLIVFIPGGAHLARIAYGVPPFQASDFLAYHLSALGYSFLGISYPIESTDTEGDPLRDEEQDTSILMPPAYPAFSIADWGRQTAEITARVVSEKSLQGEVALVVWSMGGRMVVPYMKHATALGLRINSLFALAASPGLLDSNPPMKNAQCSEKGYAKCGDKFEKWFLDQIRRQQEQFEGGREVLSYKAWREDYFGHTPVSLMGWKLRSVWSEETGYAFTEDVWRGTIDSGATDFASLPNWIATLYPSSMMDPKHALLDQANWGYLMTHKLTSRVTETMAKAATLGGEEDNWWQRVMGFVHSVPARLSCQMPGNHFFFLGHTGARRTAMEIDRLLNVTNGLETELQRMLEEINQL